MTDFTREAQNDQVLVESTPLEFILGPIRKTTRLKYKCAAVSHSLVALGSNTGGIYLFSRSEQKLLQIAFAVKETNSVVSLQLSPNEKFVAFVSGQGTIYVLELKLGTNAKSETLRSTSGLAGTRITSLHWDPNSTKLYIGDDNGKVSVMPVSSNKAKNLFRQEIEVIMKLDAPVVQIDKAEQHVLVSTTTKVYLCDTVKLNYRQVGKKLRDGPYGACFLSQDSETSMIYCARPGSRIWEVDCNGSVLNTHQFKQLILGVAPSSVVDIKGEYPDLETKRYNGELANFSKLKVLCGIFLLTWSSEVIYILDPINVKLILWINQFTGIIDVTCLGNEVFIFQDSMEITHLAIMPVSEVVPLCLNAQNISTAARLCIAYKSVLHHKHVRKKLSVVDLFALHDRLISLDRHDLAEQLHTTILGVEGKIALESDSDSNRSRSSSILSNLEHSCEDTSKNKPKSNVESSHLVGQYENHNIEGNVYRMQSQIEQKSDEHNNEEINTQNNTLDMSGTDTIDGSNKIHTSDGDEQITTRLSHSNTANLTETDLDNINQENGKEDNYVIKTIGVCEIHSNIYENNVIPTNGPMNVNIDDIHNSEESNKYVSETNTAESVVYDEQVSIATEGNADIEEDMVEADMRTSGLGSRRHSLTSLSSISSAEVFLDQKQQNAMPGHADGPIAMPVKKKSIKKRRSRKSVGDTVDTQHKEGMMSPTGSLQEAPIEEGQENSGLLQENDYFFNKGKNSADKNPDSLSIGSPLSNSAEFELSGREMARSGEFSTSLDTALPDSPLQESWEKNMAATSKIKLKKMKDKMQTTVTSKTKNLIRNIKEKNLLTKAKELAENLSHVSENNKFLFGDGPYIDQVDFTSKTVPDENPNENHENVEEIFDYSVSKIESVVNLEQLTTITEETMVKLNKVDILLNPEASRKALVEWVTVLNETFYKLHMKKFMPCGPNEIEESADNSNSATHDSVVLMNGEEDCKLRNELDKSGSQPSVDRTQDSAANGNQNILCKQGSELETSDSAKAESDVFSSIPHCQMDKDTLDTRWTHGASILCDKDFGYCKDPLCLPIELYKDVCQLAQVCFDTDIHGDILKYRFVTKSNDKHQPQVNSLVNGCKQSLGLTNETYCDKLQAYPTDACNKHSVIAVVKESENNEDSQTKENCDTHKDNRDFEASSKEIKNNKTLDDDKHTKTGMESAEIGDIKDTKTDDLSPTKADDLNPTKADNLSAFSTDNPSSTKTDKESVKTDEFSTATTADNQTTTNEFSTTTTNTISARINDGEELIVNKDWPSLSVGGKENTNDRRTDDGDLDKEAMAFYLRCYFPYLTLSKVQERLQTENDTFELWSAFVSCLQGHVVNDSERLGIQKSTVIDHLIETHYHSDNSTLLLGHVSRMFLRWDGSAVSSVVNICVKCFPHIQPINVLYLCRLYNVDINTVFQQYMFLLCDHISKTHRSDKNVLGTDIYSHIEVKCAWLEVLLAEEGNGNQTVVMDTNGKPRKGSHRLRWRNEFYLGKVISSEHTGDDGHRILKICYRYGYWCGVLRFTKKLGLCEDHLQTILYLGDTDLISAEHELGYLPTTVADWEHLTLQFLAHISNNQEPSKDSDREPGIDTSLTLNKEPDTSLTLDEESDTSLTLDKEPGTSLTLDSLCQTMLQYVGPEQTLAILDKLVPERKVSAELYQSCLLASLVQKQQRSILHTMLEAVDSYLWSQRPNELSPQLNMCLTQGKEGQIDMDANSEVMQQLLDVERGKPFIEDPDCHWGVEARNSLRCCSCNNLLRATVSLDQSGVLIFRCGHGYHVVCLPEEQCLICIDED